MVGHNPDPFPPVRGAHSPSTHHERPAGVVLRFQRSHDLVSASQAQRRDVLNENARWSNGSNKLEPAPPQSGSGTGESGTLPGGADVLAGEPAGPDGPVGGPSGPLESEREAADPGEEVAVSEPVEVGGDDVTDVPLVNVTTWQATICAPGTQDVAAPGVHLVVVDGRQANTVRS